MRILIVGAGIAGCSLYRRLKEQAFEVDIIEKESTLTSEGAAICLPANAMLELQKLGLSEQIKEHAHQVNEIEYALADGTTLAKASLNEPPLNKAPFVSLKRDSLMKVLRYGIEHDIQLGSWLTELTQTATHAQVTFNNGQQKDYDLVVAADGINSQVRSFVQPDTPLIKPSVTNWRFITTRPEASTEPVYYVGNDALFMIYPMSNNEVYCYGHIIDKTGKYYAMTAKSAMTQIFSDYASPVVQCINTLSDNTHIVTGELKSVACTNPVFGNVVLIGDALHGCPPSLQQGAGMALEDVDCLASLIASGDDVPSILKQFKNMREQRVTWTVNESNKIIKLASLGQTFLGRILRNAIIRRKGPANVVGWRKLLS